MTRKLLQTPSETKKRIQASKMRKCKSEQWYRIKMMTAINTKDDKYKCSKTSLNWLWNGVSCDNAWYDNLILDQIRNFYNSVCIFNNFWLAIDNLYCTTGDHWRLSNCKKNYNTIAIVCQISAINRRSLINRINLQKYNAY